ncbi:MAG: PaaI family thioesterase [Bacteroidales bacterium]|nr:PaaI family thioesterase [Bacteroidales bacterium]
MSEKTTQTLELLKMALNAKGKTSPSPFTNWLQPTVLEANYGSLTFEYVIRKEMTNPAGALHGGAVAGIMDDTMGATLFSMEKGAYVTVNLDVNYFAPAREGDVIRSRSTVVKEGKKVIHMECELWLADDGKMLAKASSNLMRP